MHIRRLPTRWEVVGLDLSERCQRRSTFFHLLRHVRAHTAHTERSVSTHTNRKSIRLRSRRRQVQKLFSQMRCVCTRCRSSSSSTDGNDSGGGMHGRKKWNGISEHGFSIHSRTRTNDVSLTNRTLDCAKRICYCVRRANEWIVPLSTTLVRFHPSWLLSRVSSFSLLHAHSHSKLRTDELLPP